MTLEQWVKEEAEYARREARTIGLAEGRAEGRAEGFSEWGTIGEINGIIKLVRNGKLTYEDALSEVSDPALFEDLFKQA